MYSEDEYFLTLEYEILADEDDFSKFGAMVQLLNNVLTWV